MDSDQTTNNILITLAECQCAFTADAEKLSASFDSEIDHEPLERAITRDPRFILLQDAICGEKHFVAKKALFHWFIKLTIRLAKAQRVRLNSSQLAAFMSSLRPYGQWKDPPIEAILFGRRFGFIGPAYKTNQYVFPIAHTISCTRSPRIEVVTCVLQGVAEMCEPNLERLFLESFRYGFKGLSPKHLRILQSREGLFEDTQMTLQQIGNKLGVSRERIRQIEGSVWAKLRNPTRSQHFLASLLYYIMLRQGSLLVGESSSEAPLVEFIAKCVGLPLTKIRGTKLLVIGASTKETVGLKNIRRFPSNINADQIAAHLESKGQLCLMNTDLIDISDSIARFHRERLTKGQKVYLALRSIGKPAHYAEVTEVYNSLFPDYLSSEHNMHAVLSREVHSIVWIGVRGVFALQEWGYEHPEKGLFDSVTEIVENKFAQTGKPVSFDIIVAEIGKYRRVVKSSSLTIASHCNPRLERVYEDCFIPKDPATQVQEEISMEELDRILREFEKQVRR